MRRRALPCAAVVVCALLTASCGSDGGGGSGSGSEGADSSTPPVETTASTAGEPSAEVSGEAAAWATEVCGSLQTWAEDLSAVGEELEADADIGDLSGLRDTVGEAIDATQALLDELDTISPPETEQGEATQEALDQLGEDARDGLEEIEQGLDDLEQADTAQEGLQALLDVATQVGEQLGPVGDTLDELEAQDPDSELIDALRADPACQSLEG